MHIDNEFSVSAPAERVFETLLDFERIGPCIPGATVGQPNQDGVHPAEIAVRLGPMRLTYRGTVHLQDADRSVRRASLAADVREVRGQGAAKATMTMTVSDESGRSRVSSATEVQLSGRAAQMGAGIVEDVAGRLVADMAANLERMLESEPPGPPGSADDVSRGGQSRPATAAAGAPVTGPAEAPALGGAGAPERGAPERSAPERSAPEAAAPIGGLRLLLRALWYRLRHGRRASRQTT